MGMCKMGRPLLKKVCSKCKIEKTADKFSPRKDRKSGLYSCCKDCKSAYQRKRNKTSKFKEDRKIYRSRKEVKEAENTRRRKWLKTEAGRLWDTRRKHNRRARKKEIKREPISSKWLRDLWNNTKTCIICETELENHKKYPNGKHLDHIVPIYKGGSHTKDNLRYICAKCNVSRG